MPAKRIGLVQRYNAKKAPLLLDGATGSLLQQRGFLQDKFLWYSKINIDNPEAVKSIHNDYIEAGADIITTNTFRTNPSAINLSGYDINLNEFVKTGVDIAIAARGEKQIIVAGSNTSAEDCYQSERTVSPSELDYNHKKHIEYLWESGCDIIWNETHSHWDEIEIISKFCSLNSLPFSISFYFTEELKLLSGEPLNEIMNCVSNYNPTAVGFNCIKPASFMEYIQKYEIPENWGFYFNCGAGNITDEKINTGIDPGSYVNIVKELLRFKPYFIGSCCGSTPSHTRAIKELLNEVYRN